MFIKFLQTPSLLLGVLAFAVVSANANIAQGGLFPRLHSSVIPAVSRRIIPEVEGRSLTNAKRLASGLPLNPPHRRVSRTSAARRSSPSGAPTPGQGYIEVFDVATDTSQGYLTGINFGLSGLTTDSTKYMTFTLPMSATSRFINIPITNPPDSLHPYLGGMEGEGSSDASIGQGNSNYLYLGSTGQTSPGSSPNNNAGSTLTATTSIPAPVESSIWLYDLSTGSITAQWVNPDSSEPTTYIMLSAGELYLTGDVASFQTIYGGFAVYFTFVSI